MWFNREDKDYKYNNYVDSIETYKTIEERENDIEIRTNSNAELRHTWGDEGCYYAEFRSYY